MNEKINFPKITIITPTFNSEKDLEACILSVANQTYENKEHLIIDGLSSDGTLAIAKKYADEYSHIKWISEKDEGIYDAMNNGIDMATGEWIYFLGSDDIFYNGNVLEKVFENEENLIQDVLYGNVLWGDTGKIYDGKFSLLKLMQKNICHQAIFFKKSVFEKLGKFETKYKVLADWFLNIKWMNDESIKNKYINVVIAKYNTNGYSSKLSDERFKFDVESGDILKYFPVEYSENYKTLKRNSDEIDNKKNEIISKTEEVELLNKEINKKERRMMQLKNKIHFMESSKFWKLRSSYIKIKNKILHG